METLEQTKLSADEAKGEFTRAVDRLVKDYASTPDDKINWSPSPTCRTATEVMAHCGLSISGMQDWISGKPFPFESMQALDDFSRNEEKKYTTRDSVLTLVNENAAKYLAYLDSLSQETLGSMFETPMGTFPMLAAITFSADHIRSHGAQIEYIQTVYGDREMHM